MIKDNLSEPIVIDPEKQPSKDSAMRTEPGLSLAENALLNSPLPYNLSPQKAEELWAQYQAVIGGLLVRMGSESKILDSVARFVLVRRLKGVYPRLALLPKLGYSAMHVLEKHGLGDLAYRVAGELSLMELSAAAGYRTFCLPELVRGLVKSGKMRNQPIERMMDTFDFLKTMFVHPLNDQRVADQFRRTNKLHGRYQVAGAASLHERDLFKYIGLNMFYIGPSMRPDLTPQERHAICGLTVLVAKHMGHTIDGTVKELEAFIADYEAAEMFNPNDHSELRRSAVEIAQASKKALEDVPTISPARIHGYVPYRVKKILEI